MPHPIPQLDLTGTVVLQGLLGEHRLKESSEMSHDTHTDADRTAVQLTSRIVAGDQAALAAFYHRYFEVMYRFAHKASGFDESRCMDVVQDTMLRILKSMRRPIDTEIALHAWLRTVVYSVAFDHLKSDRRRTIREHRYSGPSSPAETTAITNLEDGDSIADQDAGRMDWLREELANMVEEQSRLVEMRFRFNWTLQRIGQSLGLSHGAVDGRLQRILQKLRDRAADAADEEGRP